MGFVSKMNALFFFLVFMDIFAKL